MNLRHMYDLPVLKLFDYSFIMPKNIKDDNKYIGVISKKEISLKHLKKE